MGTSIDWKRYRGWPGEPQSLFRCRCGAEMIGVYVDEEMGNVEMAFWTWGNRPSQPGPFIRLRHIWHILRYGHPYVDQIILERDELEHLAATLRTAAELIDKSVKEEANNE